MQTQQKLYQTIKGWQRKLLVVCCLFGIGISALYHGNSIKMIWKISAPVYLNIEINKNFAPFVSVVTSGKLPEYHIERLSTDTNSQMHNIVLHSEIVDLVRGVYLHIPKETAAETLNAIEAVSVFIGNKLFYFSHADIINLQGIEQDNHLLIKLIGLEYNRSIASLLLNNFVFANYYGDLNTLAEVFMLFTTRPYKFVLTWFFIFCLLFLLKQKVIHIYDGLKKLTLGKEILLLIFLLLIAFTLRINGYVRYSAWFDELYSIFIVGNPALPFNATFNDPGNPPFYNILLRYWFSAFGWTEYNGRLFSVLIGTAAIIPFYIFLKRFAKRSVAFLAALYMAISGLLIGYSQEIRAYILLVFLVPIMANYFMVIIETQKFNFKHIIRYIIPAILLVNTHYYGSLLVFSNFLFFILYSVTKKSFSWKNTVLFFICHLIIALSLSPYFIFTAFNQALLNSNFNAWIKKPSGSMIIIAAIIPVFMILYIYLRSTMFKKNASSPSYDLVDYLVFSLSTVFLIAFGVSMLYRPILSARYLIILYPFLIAFLAVIFAQILPGITSKYAYAVCAVFMFLWLVNGYETNRGGSSSVFRESLAFIAHEAAAHPERTSLELSPYSYYRLEHFYGYNTVSPYSPGDNYDVLFFNPLHRSQKAMFATLNNLAINQNSVLKIRVNERVSIFKIYSDNSP